MFKSKPKEEEKPKAERGYWVYHFVMADGVWAQWPVSTSKIVRKNHCIEVLDKDPERYPNKGLKGSVELDKLHYWMTKWQKS